jgi:stage III sporulation protein AG
MDYLRKIFNNGNKKNLINLGVSFLVGVALIISSSIFFKNKPDILELDEYAYTNDSLHIINTKTKDKNFEESLESRLEELLTTVSGVGIVKVMVTLANGKEIVVASNTTIEISNTDESDSEGGTRKSEDSKNTEQKIIIKDQNNVDKPLILKEVEAKVEGVIIVAQGAGNAQIKELLSKAAQTVLGVDENKVQVLKMK